MLWILVYGILETAYVLNESLHNDPFPTETCRYSQCDIVI